MHGLVNHYFMTLVIFLISNFVLCSIENEKNEQKYSKLSPNAKHNEKKKHFEHPTDLAADRITDTNVQALMQSAHKIDNMLLSCQ